MHTMMVSQKTTDRLRHPKYLDDIAGSSLAFCADHSCPFGNTTQGLPEICCPANEGNTEGVLVNMTLQGLWHVESTDCYDIIIGNTDLFIRRGEDLRLIDIIRSDGFHYLI
jgi:hypothetical protein